MDDALDQMITRWVAAAGLRAARAFAFTVATAALLWAAPYDMPSAVVIGLAVGFLSIFNIGARMSALAIGFLLFVALTPKEIVLHILN